MKSITIGMEKSESDVALSTVADPEAKESCGPGTLRLTTDGSSERPWSNVSYAAIIAMAVASIFVIVAVDYFTKGKLHLELFYVFPIGAVAWHIGRRAAFGAGAVTAIVWQLTDHWVEGFESPMTIGVGNALLRMAFLAGVAEVLGRLRGAHQREKWLSSRDSLTEVLNGRAFHDVVEAEIERCRRYGRSLSFAYLDVDDFKRVNDEHGHQAGDALLQHVARMLRSNLRSVDVIARLGGDEFAVMLPETDGPSGRAALEKVHARLFEQKTSDGLTVSLSIGLVTFDRAAADVNEVLMRADALMYEAKRDGKNCLRAAVV